MTVRAVLIGLVGAVFVTTIGYYADHVAHLNRFVAGQFPIMTYGPLVLVVLLLNPVLGRVRRGWRLRGPELVVVIVATLAAASITNNGLLRYFTRALLMPVHMNERRPGWKENRALEEVPPVMLANGGAYDEDLTYGFTAGLGDGNRLVPLERVPWAKWRDTLFFWGSVILLLAVASVCLALIVHPQWSRRELLPYPIAGFARAMLDGAEPGGGTVFRRRWFLIGAGFLLFYHLNNGACAWWPDVTVRIPLAYNFSPVHKLFPWLRFGWASWSLVTPTFWPAAVALAFFLEKDVTFSVGISQPLATVIGATLVGLGLWSSQGMVAYGDPFQWQRAGSCVALALMLIYIGRHYYRQVAVEALTGRRSPDRVERSSVWAFRVLLLCVVALTVLLAVAARLDWPLALAFVLLALLAYICVARITAEFGIFYVQIIWLPVGVILGLMGTAALGVSALVILAMLSGVLLMQPEESLMAFVSQGLKIGEGRGIGRGSLGCLAGTGFAIALVAAVPFALWVDYSYGGCRTMAWDSQGQPGVPFGEGLIERNRLEATGELRQSRSLTALGRLAAAEPDRRFLWSSGIGIALVVLAYMARLRWPWWPLHPVMFLIWETWASATFFYSFLLAWAIQVAVTKFGGTAGHRRAKHFMIGVVVGELTGGMLWLIVGAVYYWVTSKTPPYYNIFPY